MSKFWLFIIESIIIFPSLIGELVTCGTVDAPDIDLPRQVLVDQKVFSAHSNAYLRSLVAFLQPVNSVLEVENPVLHLRVSHDPFLSNHSPLEI